MADDVIFVVMSIAFYAVLMAAMIYKAVEAADTVILLTGGLHG